MFAIPTAGKFGHSLLKRSQDVMGKPLPIGVQTRVNPIDDERDFKLPRGGLSRPPSEHHSPLSGAEVEPETLTC
jgi:hypothetical protein